MKSTSNNGQYYIVNIDDPNDKVEFQFIPFELKDSRTANLSKVEIVGRNHPKRHYLGGDNVLTFQLEFHATKEDIQDVKNSAFKLQGLATGKNVKLIWGNLYQNNVWTMELSDVTWKQQDLELGYPEIAVVDIRLTANPLKSITAEQIKQGNY